MNETAWYEEQEASYVQAFKDRPAYYFGAIILACVAVGPLHAFAGWSPGLAR